MKRVFVTLIDVAEDDVLKRALFNKSVSKLDGIQTNIPSRTGLINKSQNDNDKQNIKKMKMSMKMYPTLIQKLQKLQKKPNIISLLTKTNFHAKLQRLKMKYLIIVV